ncbi:MAG: tripartite tricarboxylate transporter substrate binding protein [Betaproteobacteria bacterium]
MPMLSQCRLVMSILPAAGFILGSSLVHAQETYPSRPIRLLIPMAAGGASDILMRTLSTKMSDILGQQIVIDNRPGANGVIGEEMVAHAAPDGYTWLVTSIAIAINPSLYNPGYNVLTDLIPVSNLAGVDLLLGVYPGVPAKNVMELIAYAKANPNKLNYASFGVGSIAHMAGELFKQASKTEIVHIAYKATPQAVQETIAGQTQMVFGGTPYMVPHAHGGRLRGVAVSSLRRSPLAPEIPTLDESGLPGFDVTAWFAMFVPAHTPPRVVARVNAVLAEVLRDAQVRGIIEKQGFRPNGDSSAEFAKFFRAEVAKFGALVKAAGIKPEN